jgi:protein O-mannosyl-transferase
MITPLAAPSGSPPNSDPARSRRGRGGNAAPAVRALEILPEIVRRRPRSSVLLALALLGLIAYANALPNSFHFDDNEGIVSNASLRSLANIPAYFTDPIIFRFTRRLDWRPILQITYALDYAIGGLNSTVFNLTNLLFHIGTAWLIFLTVAEIGRQRPARFSPVAGVSAAWISFGAAALFTVHTVNTQTVDYVWARSSLLAAFFYLLAFYCHLRGPLSGASERNLSWHLAALGAFAFSLGSKATAVSLPATLLAYEALFLNPAWRNPVLLYLKEPRRLIKYIPTLAVLLAYIALRSVLMPKSTATYLISTSWVSRSTYLFTQFRAWVYYIRLYLWPDPLIFDYPGFGWSTSLWSAGVLASLALVLAINIGAWLVRRRQPLLSFFTFWFFITLLPEASIIVRPDEVTGHRPYLAYAGLSVIAALVGFRFAMWIWRRRKHSAPPEAYFRLACGVLLGLVLVALTGATIRRNLDWRDEIALWNDVIRKDPTNARAYMSLGLKYVKQENYEKALALLDQAVRMSPGYAEAYVHRGNLNLLIGRYDQALSDLTLAIERGGDLPFAFLHRGEVYRKLGRYDEALKDYKSALQLAPQFPDAYFGIAMVYWERKELPQATTTCRKLLEIEPDSRRSYICLGSLLMHQGIFSEARNVYHNGVVLFPQNSTLWYGLGTAYEELGLYKEARDAYSKSSSLERETSLEKRQSPLVQ